MKIMKINYDVINKIKNSKNIAIFIHVNPDGDCIGAASAFKECLNLMNKEADIYCDDEVTDRYLFIKHMKEIKSPKLEKYDLGVALDCSDLNRLGKHAALFKSIKDTIKIDHHSTKEDFAGINVVEPVSSTCLMLYYYILELIEKLNGDIACSLYAGISTDTGSFLHSNTTYLEHVVAAELLKYDFNLENLNYMLFKRKTLNQVALLRFMYNNIKFYCNNKLAIITFDLKDLNMTNACKSDTLGFADFACNIEGVEIGVTICEEKKGLYSCSFRSGAKYNVNVIAEQFGGGGHARAAGCNIFGHSNTVEKKIIDAVSSVMKLKN